MSFEVDRLDRDVQTIKRDLDTVLGLVACIEDRLSIEAIALRVVALLDERREAERVAAAKERLSCHACNIGLVRSEDGRTHYINTGFVPCGMVE